MGCTDSTMRKNHELPSTQSFRQAALLLASTLTIQYTQDRCYLSVSSIEQICNISIQLISNEYSTLTYKNRISNNLINKERRQINLEDFNTYQQFILDYIEQCDGLIESSQKAICQSLNIPYEQFQDSLIFWVDQGSSKQISIIEAQVNQKLKQQSYISRQSIKNKSTVDVSKVSTLFELFLSIYSNFPDKLKNSLQQIKVNQQTNTWKQCLNIYTADMIYDKMNLEEEDYISCLSNPNMLAYPQLYQLIVKIDLQYQLLVEQITAEIVDEQ